MRGLFGALFRQWSTPSDVHVLRVRDVDGVYRTLSLAYVVHHGEFRVALAFDGEAPALLRPQQVGWVRGRLRDDVLAAASAIAAARGPERC